MRQLQRALQAMPHRLHALPRDGSALRRAWEGGDPAARARAEAVGLRAARAGKAQAGVSGHPALRLAIFWRPLARGRAGPPRRHLGGGGCEADREKAPGQLSNRGYALPGPWMARGPQVSGVRLGVPREQPARSAGALSGCGRCWGLSAAACGCKCSDGGLADAAGFYSGRQEGPGELVHRGGPAPAGAGHPAGGGQREGLGDRRRGGLRLLEALLL
mmetsp:Transcript_36060/g.107783  ORF Transcript_36060/g.107783 Transcript_36060/m.107783 type:complete len:217 (-) Transcript_36060:1355-2005(-)